MKKKSKITLQAVFVTFVIMCDQSQCSLQKTQSLQTAKTANVGRRRNVESPSMQVEKKALSVERNFYSEYLSNSKKVAAYLRDFAMKLVGSIGDVGLLVGSKLKKKINEISNNEEKRKRAVIFIWTASGIATGAIIHLISKRFNSTNPSIPANPDFHAADLPKTGTIHGTKEATPAVAKEVTPAVATEVTPAVAKEATQRNNDVSASVGTNDTKVAESGGSPKVDEVMDDENLNQIQNDAVYENYIDLGEKYKKLNLAKFDSAENNNIIVDSGKRCGKFLLLSGSQNAIVNIECEAAIEGPLNRMENEQSKSDVEKLNHQKASGNNKKEDEASAKPETGKSRQPYSQNTGGWSDINFGENRFQYPDPKKDRSRRRHRKQRSIQYFGG